MFVIKKIVHEIEKNLVLPNFVRSHCFPFLKTARPRSFNQQVQPGSRPTVIEYPTDFQLSGRCL
jgi:hypothetical protein